MAEGDIGWKARSFVRVADTAKATLDLDDFTQAPVRRKLLSNDGHVPGDSGRAPRSSVARPPGHQGVLGGHLLTSTG